MPTLTAAPSLDCPPARVTLVVYCDDVLYIDLQNNGRQGTAQRSEPTYGACFECYAATVRQGRYEECSHEVYVLGACDTHGRMCYSIAR